MSLRTHIITLQAISHSNYSNNFNFQNWSSHILFSLRLGSGMAEYRTQCAWSFPMALQPFLGSGCLLISVVTPRNKSPAESTKSIPKSLQPRAGKEISKCTVSSVRFPTATVIYRTRISSVIGIYEVMIPDFWLAGANSHISPKSRGIPRISSRSASLEDRISSIQGRFRSYSLLRLKSAFWSHLSLWGRHPSTWRT